MKPFYPLPSEIAPLLDGKQTAIVRPVNNQPEGRGLRYEIQFDGRPGWEDWHGYQYDCPFGNPGTLLYGKEGHLWDENGKLYFRADKHEFVAFWGSPVMLRKQHARLWLELLDVKVCKLMDLTNEEMYETGVRIDDSYRLGISTGCEGSVEGFNLGDGIRRVFYEIFDEKFGRRKVTNPWIWYATVKRIDKPESV